MNYKWKKDFEKARILNRISSIETKILKYGKRSRVEQVLPEKTYGLSDNEQILEQKNWSEWNKYPSFPEAWLIFIT